MLCCRHQSCSEPAAPFSVFCTIHHADQLRQFGITLPDHLSWIDRGLGLLARGIITRPEFINFTIDELAAGIDFGCACKLNAALPADLNGALLDRLNELKATDYHWEIFCIPGPADLGPPGVYAKALELAHLFLLRIAKERLSGTDE